MSLHNEKPVYELRELDYSEQAAHCWECTECGVIVITQDTHDRWHARIDKISERAGQYVSPPVYGRSL